MPRFELERAIVRTCVQLPPVAMRAALRAVVSSLAKQSAGAAFHGNPGAFHVMSSPRDLRRLVDAVVRQQQRPRDLSAATRVGRVSPTSQPVVSYAASQRCDLVTRVRALLSDFFVTQCAALHGSLSNEGGVVGSVTSVSATCSAGRVWHVVPRDGECACTREGVPCASNACSAASCKPSATLQARGGGLGASHNSVGHVHSIRAALQAATEGDVVAVWPGEFHERSGFVVRHGVVVMAVPHLARHGDVGTADAALLATAHNLRRGVVTSAGLDGDNLLAGELSRSSIQATAGLDWAGCGVGGSGEVASAKHRVLVGRSVVLESHAALVGLALVGTGPLSPPHPNNARGTNCARGSASPQHVVEAVDAALGVVMLGCSVNAPPGWTCLGVCTKSSLVVHTSTLSCARPRRRQSSSARAIFVAGLSTVVSRRCVCLRGSIEARGGSCLVVSTTSILDSPRSGVSIRGDAEVLLTACHVVRPHWSGVEASSNGRAVLQACSVVDSAKGGLLVSLVLLLLLRPPVQVPCRS